MNCQFLLLKSLCVFLIASSAHGEPLPKSSRLRYAYCVEIRQFTTDGPTAPPPGSVVIDNLCMDSNGLTFHFVSSAQGGTTSYISAPKSDMTCVFLDFNTMGIKLERRCRSDVNVVFQFLETANAMRVYDEIYELKILNRENFTISRIEKLLLDRENGSRIIYHTQLTQHAGVYVELYKFAKKIFTVKGESADGDIRNPVLIFLVKRFNISGVLVNNNVLLRLHKNYPLYNILTFADGSEAHHFYQCLHDYVDEQIEIPIPPVVQEVLKTIRA